MRLQQFDVLIPTTLEMRAHTLNVLGRTLIERRSAPPTELLECLMAVGAYAPTGSPRMDSGSGYRAMKQIQI